MEALLVLVGGGVGAVARYVLDGLVKSAAGKSFPWGTLTVNVLAAAVLGALHGAGAGTDVEALMGTGLCGALSTFSTFELDTVHLFQNGHHTRAAVYALGSLLLGFAVFLAFHGLLAHLT
ncbi:MULTISPECIES: fluoride efflux transporter CrcB [Actinomadura]|uniref:Fluoride-specific ion channel FluC n=1 Tax=Actinomadura litoris TaxID=2678616 RepID=A0A7K1LE90_9ACTN|nr:MULTISPECIES: fluoride efflux transporter CrcB [Actinomadura]MBT2212707.1 fluoride efflux transporter CrcB [Actinomadura sp. NEAU-AAG7]MUN42732.1 fluoride efflux transporter CrcB [Actinomadura litoris]